MEASRVKMKLTCINIPTTDTKRFAEFYNQVLGAKIIEPVPGRYEVFSATSKKEPRKTGA
jgi:catechol 2,3-dioxygenase-like lactoylglutathione lyase family enzyme